jgi:hypothetical protein
LVEQIDDARLWRTQRMLSHGLWDQDAVRDLCWNQVIELTGQGGANTAVSIRPSTGHRAEAVFATRLLAAGTGLPSVESPVAKRQ